MLFHEPRLITWKWNGWRRLGCEERWSLLLHLILQNSPSWLKPWSQLGERSCWASYHGWCNRSWAAHGLGEQLVRKWYMTEQCVKMCLPILCECCPRSLLTNPSKLELTQDPRPLLSFTQQGVSVFFVLVTCQASPVPQKQLLELSITATPGVCCKWRGFCPLLLNNQCSP